MSASAIGCANTICVCSLRRTCTLLSTEITSPPALAAVMVPRTRVGACAAAVATASTARKTKGPRRSAAIRVPGSVFRLDPVLAHLDAVGDHLAVGFDARVGPDRLAALQRRAVAVVEA